MISVAQLAQHMLEKSGPQETMKLQKLVYYVQAWHLARHNRGAVREEVEAWPYGPVFPDLYALHRKMLVVTRLPDVEMVSIPPSVVKMADWVLSTYGRLTGAQLSRLVHAEEPFKTVIHRLRAADGDMQRERIIGKQTMRAYYRQIAPPSPSAPLCSSPAAGVPQPQP